MQPPKQRIAVVATVAIFVLSLTSCETLRKRDDPANGLVDGISTLVTAPAWAEEKLDPIWWAAFENKSLTRDIEAALANSPGLSVIAARLDTAEAKSKLAQATTKPRLNLGFGYREGKEREVDFGPYDLAPWKGTAQFDWELDFFGRLKNLKDSASKEQQAAFHDLEAAKLQLSVAVAATHFRITRLLAEEKQITGSIEANRNILEIFKDRENSGLATESETLRASAEQENLNRSGMEISRLRKLAEVELSVLKGGGSESENTTPTSLPRIPPIPEKSFDELLSSHPGLLAAEARVRSAFHLENSARLNLLPSFRLNGSTFGSSTNFLLDQLAKWQTQIGPTLDLPVFDPARIAKVKINRAATNEAAALYRETLVSAFGDIQSAYINLENRRRQNTSVNNEVGALIKARSFTREQFEAGVVSQIDVLEAERRTLATERDAVVIHEQALSDYLALVRALGGGF